MPSTKTYVAFLRGINVSGKNKVPMKELVTLCADLGWDSVQTHLQTGNIVFTTTRSVTTLEWELEQSIDSHLGRNWNTVSKIRLMLSL